MTPESVNRELRQIILTLSRRVSVLEGGGGGSGMTQLTGDVTAGPGSGSQVATIPASSIEYAQIQDVSAGSRVLGADVTGPIEELIVGDGLIIDGTPPALRVTSGGGITQLTGDVTAGPGSGSQVATIPASSIDYAQIQDVSAGSRVLGADIAGPIEELIVGDGLVIDGTPPALRVTSVPGAGGGGLVFLEEHIASSSAQLDFTSWYSSAYDVYQIELIGIIPATDATTFVLQVSTDGGSTFSSSGYHWSVSSVGSSGGAPASSGTDSGTSFSISANLENTTSVGVTSGTVKVFNPGSTTRVKGFLWDALFGTADSPNHYFRWTGSGAWDTTSSAVNALRFKMASGNIAEGTIRIYGIAKS